MKKERLGFHIVLLGQISSGKDTQAKLLIEKFALFPVESGKYWRTIMKKKGKEADYVRRTVGLGHPAPTILMKKFLQHFIAKKPKGKDILFVGNPRLKPEGQLLKKLLSERKEKFLAIYITIPKKEIYKRSFSREGRTDDEVNKIKRRILWHKNQVSKTVNYFDSLGLLTKINGIGTIDQVEGRIEKAISQFKKKHQ